MEVQDFHLDQPVQDEYSEYLFQLRKGHSLKGIIGRFTSGPRLGNKRLAFYIEFSVSIEYYDGLQFTGSLIISFTLISNVHNFNEGVGAETAKEGII